MPDDRKRKTERAPPAQPGRETGASPEGDMPPAGPHARERLTNPDATPGSGALPDPDKRDGEADASTG